MQGSCQRLWCPLGLHRQVEIACLGSEQRVRCFLGMRRQVEQDEGMVRLVPDIKGSDPGAAGLLIECRGQTPQALEVGHSSWPSAPAGEASPPVSCSARWTACVIISHHEVMVAPFVVHLLTGS